MKLICRYSGETFYCNEFEGEKHNDIHPIFRVSPEELLAKAKKWSSGGYSPLESKLLFLSLLNSTGGIQFHAYAQPSASIVEGHMENAFKLVLWYSTMGHGTADFPTFRITEQNYQLTNISAWFSTWWEIKQEWYSGASRKQLQQQLEAREFVLDKLIHSPGKSVYSYAGRLADWALTVSRAPAGIKDYWKTLFYLKDAAIFKASLVDLEEIVEHMEAELNAPDSHGAGYGSTYAFKTLQHLRMIRDTCRAGPLADLQGGASYSFLDKDGELTMDIEARNITIAASLAPEQEPIAANYVGRLGQYMKDRARWSLARMKEEIDSNALKGY